MKKSYFTIVLALLLPVLSLFAQNEEIKTENQPVITDTILVEELHPLLVDKFILNTGLYFPSKFIKVRANGASTNDEIKFDKVFDFDQNEITFAFNFHWRFSRNWHLGVEYFGVKNNKTRAIDEEITWDDTIYPVGAEVEADAKLNMYRIFFGRVLSKKNNHELGVGLGAHLMDIQTSISGDVYIDDFNTKIERNSVSAIAPLPNIGFWYIYAPSNKWAFTARVDWFGIKIEDYSGSLWNLAPGVKYQVFKNLGVGLNYRYFSTKFDVDKGKWHGGLNIGYHGPLFTVSANL